MKRIMIVVALVLCFAVPAQVTAQQEEIEQLFLDIQKLAYLKNILLDLKKGYEIVFAGYHTIKSISEGNFNLHQQFLDALLQVSPTVRNYKKVADIISSAVQLVNEYKAAMKGFSLSGLFKSNELDYFTAVFKSLVDRSAKNLDALLMVITSGQLRMSDAERLSAIDDIYKDASSELTFLRQFTSEVKLLGVQKLREQTGLSSVQKIYGLNH